jgi:hypothetical protein
MTRPQFQKRHYTTLAAAIAAVRHLPHDSPQELALDLVETLCDRFRADNSKFRPDQFRRASDVNPPHGTNPGLRVRHTIHGR